MPRGRTPSPVRRPSIDEPAAEAAAPADDPPPEVGADYDLSSDDDAAEDDGDIDLPALRGAERRAPRAGGKLTKPVPERHTSGPLADDITEEEVVQLQQQMDDRKAAARKEMKRGTSSTNANYASAERHWFNVFVEWAGWKLEERKIWVLGDGTISPMAHGTWRQFLIFLDQCDVSKATLKVSFAQTSRTHAHDPLLSRFLLLVPSPLVQTCIAWAQKELNKQLAAKKMPTMVCFPAPFPARSASPRAPEALPRSSGRLGPSQTGSRAREPAPAARAAAQAARSASPRPSASQPECICNLPVVKSIKEYIYSRARITMVQAMVDLQAKVEADISPDEMLKICRHLLDMNAPETPLATMQAFFEVRRHPPSWALLAPHVHSNPAPRARRPGHPARRARLLLPPHSARASLPHPSRACAPPLAQHRCGTRTSARAATTTCATNG